MISPSIWKNCLQLWQIFKTLSKGNPMINLKTGLIILVSAAALTLAACGKKQEAQEQEAPAASASEASAVTSIEVSPDMIDAAPLEQEGSAASAAAAK